MKLIDTKSVALVMFLTLVAVADVNAQTCPSVSNDTTVESSCDTGITWTGGNLTIGSSTSGIVSISVDVDVDSAAITADAGTLGFLNNTTNGVITAGDFGKGIYSLGNITTLNNYGIISTGSFSGVGIRNDGTITTLNNLESNQCALSNASFTSFTVRSNSLSAS